jgi:hypothetical protein
MKDETNGRKPSGPNRIWLVAGISGAITVLLIGISLLSVQGNRAPSTSQVVRTDAELGARGNIRGQESARVTLVEFADFQ